MCKRMVKQLQLHRHSFRPSQHTHHHYQIFLFIFEKSCSALPYLSCAFLFIDRLCQNPHGPLYILCHRKYSTKRQLSVVSVLYLPPWNKYGQFCKCRWQLRSFRFISISFSRLEREWNCLLLFINLNLARIVCPIRRFSSLTLNNIIHM